MHDFTPTDHIPPSIVARGLADYLEVVTHPVFSAGLATQVIDAMWPGFDAAFDHFDPHAVAAYDDSDVERLVHDERIVRSETKIRATIANAATILELADEHNGFAGWLHSFDGYDAVAAAMQERFGWIGDYGVYWIMSVLDEPRPPWEEWSARYE